jgi:TonB-linked SusC/RagA family outer membrane protein
MMKTHGGIPLFQFNNNFRMKRNYLLIILVGILSCSFTGVFGQSREIRGKVTDHEDLPLAGAHVLIKGTTKGVVTDIKGEYKLTVPDNNAILVFSFVGSITEEKEVGTLSVIDVKLLLDVVGLEEIVVVGYGSVKKSDLTGSVASIKADDIVSTSVTSLDQGLIGRAAGVVVMQTSGQPGAATSIRIRGVTSLMGTNEPLYVIDGIPIISDPGATDAFASGGPALNPLASINPSDIESVEILKDASGTAIYGARGANGVILITTKRGVKNSEKISFSAYYGMQQVSRKIPMLNARQLAELGNEATDNANVGRRAIYASPTNLGEGTDWQDEIFRVAPIQNYQFSYSGGTENSTFLMSANYFNQQGIVIGSDF